MVKYIRTTHNPDGTYRLYEVDKQVPELQDLFVFCHMFDSGGPMTIGEVTIEIIKYNEMYSDAPWDLSLLPLAIQVMLEHGVIEEWNG